MAIFCLVSFLSVSRLMAAVAVRTTGQTHVVQQGETLWELASHYAASEDPRSYVQNLRDTNDLVSPQVFPGQVLVLPTS